MSFDDEIDDARKKLLSAESDGPASAFDEIEALQKLLEALKARISSRRLAFELSEGEEDDDAVCIGLTHIPSDELIGVIMADDGEYLFESDFADYFEDFVEETPEAFSGRLYEVLRHGLPEFEMDQEAD